MITEGVLLSRGGAGSLLVGPLMTIFFPIVGLEFRREIHEGALATVQLAALPLAAALGGVLIPPASTQQ